MRLLSKFLPLTLLAASLAFAANIQTVVLDVQNLTCPVCPITVKQALLKVPGVAEAKVDFDHKTATVHFDAAKANLTALTKATTDAGYPSALHKNSP